MPLVYSSPARPAGALGLRLRYAAADVGDYACTASRTASSPATALVRVNTLSLQMLVLYGSCRSDRKGIRQAQRLREELRSHGDAAELIDAGLSACRSWIGST